MKRFNKLKLAAQGWARGDMKAFSATLPSQLLVCYFCDTDCTVMTFCRKADGDCIQHDHISFVLCVYLFLFSVF